MKIFKIEIQELLSRSIDIEAENEKDALTRINEKYKNEEIVLDSFDYYETQIKMINE